MTSTRFDLRRVSRSRRETGRLNFPAHTIRGHPVPGATNVRTFTASQRPCRRKQEGHPFPRTCVSPGLAPGEAVPSREGVAREPLIVSVYPPLRDATTGRAYGQDDCRTQATPVGVIWSA